MKDSKVEKLYCVGTHHHSFRAGTPAEVIGVFMCTPDGKEPRPALKLRFEDGKEDAIPIFAAPGSTEKNPHYELITEENFKAGHIPCVAH